MHGCMRAYFNCMFNLCHIFIYMRACRHPYIHAYIQTYCDAPLHTSRCRRRLPASGTSPAAAAAAPEKNAEKKPSLPARAGPPLLLQKGAEHAPTCRMRRAMLDANRKSVSETNPSQCLACQRSDVPFRQCLVCCIALVSSEFFLEKSP